MRLAQSFSCMKNFSKLHKDLCKEHVMDKDLCIELFSKNIYMQEEVNLGKLGIVSIHPKTSLQGCWDFRWIKQLDLWGNQIETISRETFAGCESITLLSLSQNMIKVIEDRAFSHLTTLKHLCLEENNIEEMPIIG